jgi:hypothetical protein
MTTLAAEPIVGAALGRGAMLEPKPVECVNRR